MCGIAGLWAPKLASPDRLALVADMVDRVRHRGPSGTAVWEGGGLALGLASRAISDPSTPARVLENEDHTVHVVVNGEIYNHQALRLALRTRGHQVEDGPDTGGVGHLYEESGHTFASPMEGMFAIAVWNSRDRRLLLARDRAGEKPLFYIARPEGFAFASEPRPLAALPWGSREPHTRAI